MKSSGGKKYSSQPRATNPYTIDMAHTMMPITHPVDPYNHLGMGSRAHQYLMPSELEELARFAKGKPGFNLPIQPPLNNFSGNFTLSGLNLNLGAQQQQQPVHRPMPLTMVSQQQQQLQMVAEPMNCVMAPDVGFNGDSCVDLEGYWPAY